jgi:hypothetical protein
MKKALLVVLTLVSCFTRVQAQNVEGQIIAAQYGEFKVPGTTIGGFAFLPATCQVTAGGKSFPAFATGVPIKIVDGNPSLTEIATPSSVYINVCSVNMATANVHAPPYYLTSGTGGLQEAITANQTNYGVNSIILNWEWYREVLPGNAANVIASVRGIASLGLVDVTTTPYTYYTWTGSQYTVNNPTAGSVMYNQGGTGAVTRSSTAKWQDSLSIKDFGALGNGSSMAADTAGLQNAVAAANIQGKAVYIPAGNYLLNNSGGPVLSGANNIVIWGDGPSSSLACQTTGGPDCIASTGATGFGLQNLSIAFGPTATERSSGYAVDIETCNTCTLDGVTLNNGDLSGLRLASSVHTSIHNLQVSNFFANGTFLVNDQDLRVDGLACANNEDACLETSWYDSEYTAHSVPCQDITATDITSTDDLEAVLVNSCNNVTVTGFSAVGSAKEAVFVGQDPTTTTAHWPDRVSISNGSIYGSGYGSNPLNSAAAQALYINVGTSPGSFISHLAFSNIMATHISSWGLQMAELQNDDVQAGNLTFYDIGNGNSAGCVQTEGNQVNLDNIACSNIGTYAFYDTNTNRLTGTGWTASGSNQVGTGTEAVFLSPTAVGFVNVAGISLNDTNGSVFSSAVYDDTTTGDHILVNIKSSGIVAPTGPTSANQGTTYTYADPTHSWIFRNGGMIMSFLPPDVYLLPTAGATSGAYVNGSTFWWQSKCWTTSQQTESVAWLDLYPTLSTESFAFAHTGGCGFPITLDVTAAASMLGNIFTGTIISGQHFSGLASSAPTAAAGAGAGTGPTISLNANSNDLSGYLSVTTGSSPTASAIVATLTFGTAYATLPKCLLAPANAAASALSGAANVFIPLTSSESAFTVNANTTALAASTLYTWGYTCTQ